MEHSTWPTLSVITLPRLEVELGVTDVFFISCPRMAKWLVPFVVSERKSIASEVSVRLTLVKGSELELLFIVFLILKFDIALKRERFVVLSPASLSVESTNRQLERETTQKCGILGACPKLSLGWENTSFFSKHLVFSLLIKPLGQRDKGQ